MLHLLLWFAALITSADAYLVSFYGNSFLFQSMESPPLDTTTISLRFQTSSPDGLLLYALGQSQFLLLELVNGRIEVRIDLGFGEEVISTPEESSLSNLLWHEFKVVRSAKNIKIVLNNVNVASARIAAPNKKSARLGIDFGVFIGGLGGNVTLLDGTRPKFFRGCLLEAEMDGHDLLSQLKSVKKQRVVYNVLPGCPRLFRASRSEPITFDSPSAYVDLKRWTTQDEGTFECAIKTAESSGVILYNAGRSRGEFIGLEMADGVIAASVNKGGGVVTLHSTSTINDGFWHTLRFSFSPSYLDIRIDGKRTKAFIEQTSASDDSLDTVQHRNLDLTGHLYIGGVPDSLFEENAVPHSLLSLGTSEGKATIGGAFPGCMKNIRINHRRKGFPDFLTSNKVSAGCNPALKYTEFKLGNDDFTKANDQVSNIFASYKSKVQLQTTIAPTTTTAIPTTTTLEFVMPEPDVSTGALSVVEGGSAKLSQEQIHFTLSESSTMISESNILFFISTYAMHGYLSKSPSCSSEEDLSEISLEDITMGLISYCHDGSETLQDHFNFSIVWDIADKSQTERRTIISQLGSKVVFLSSGIALNSGRTYHIPIFVSAVDDLPELRISMEYIFQPVKHVSTHLPKSVLNATDPDSSKDEIIYTVLESGGNEQFRIENVENPGQKIQKFTQNDVDLSKVVFIHEGQRNNTRLFLRVSNPDNMLSSAVASVLRVMAVPLHIRVSVEPIRMLEKSAIIFTSEHISVTSNAEPGSVVFNCVIEKRPKLGVIEKKFGNKWNDTDSFVTNDIEAGVLRYRNIRRIQLSEDSYQDSFQFTVHAAGVMSHSINFEIDVRKVEVSLYAKAILLHNGVQEKQIVGNNLNVNITHVVATNNQIQLFLPNSPQHIEVFYNDNGLLIDEGDSFTLDEAKTGRISVRVKQKFATRAFQELISIQAVVNELYMSATAKLNVTYIPDLDRILLVNKGLELDEGQQQVIPAKMLKASLPPSPVNDKVKHYQFDITDPPKHGSLFFSNGRGNSDDNGDVDYIVSNFTSLDVENGKLNYRHDDSETEYDYFSLRVSPILEGQLPRTIAKLSSVFLDANFSIHINLVNDQRPVRVVNQPFEIARNGERLVTKEDLWYHDADSNYDDLDLFVVRRGITNGDILNATSRRHESVLRFTQRQIINGEVLFKHRGNDYGRFVFWVRDGKHYATGLFTISASDPFVEVVNCTQMDVIKGKEAVITSANLGTKTNVKGLSKDIVYRVINPPRNGLLYINTSHFGDTPEATTTFSQEDINNKILVYEHGGSPVIEDSFNFIVSAGDISEHGNLTIKAFLESHHKAPSVQKNRTITVLQGEKGQIRKQDLRVVHPDTRANDIVFTVIQHPFMGSLEFISDVDSEEFNSKRVTEFTQADINRGLVWFAQNESFTYNENDFNDGLLLDKFTFKVSNGILTLNNLSYYIDIIPSKIPLRLGNFSVPEGRSKAIIKEYLDIEGYHYDDREVQIKVVTPPTHGIFESTQQIGVSLKSFSYKLAAAEFLYYAHDGSDDLQDEFSLQAFTVDGKHQSDIITGYIKILPQNDESPVVVNNTGLNVWSNSVTELPSTALAVDDPDSLPEDINYRILPPSNGWVALRDDPSKPILNFTQVYINERRIVFVHKGASTGGFTFQADDGVNYATKSIFVITASPLIISVKTTKNIQAFPGQRSPVPPDAIQSITNDVNTPNRDITYFITTQPQVGKLIRKTESSVEGSTHDFKLLNFTQTDVSSGSLVFEQDATFERWSEIDSFVVTASSPPADDVAGIKVTVNITYDAIEAVGKTSPIAVNEGFTVIEGGSFPFNSSLLDATNLYKKLPLHRDTKHYELIYTITKLPLHGNISVSGKNISKVNTSFTHTQLQSAKIAYSHDHSDTVTDNFAFGVYLTDKRFSSSSGKPWIVPGTHFEDTFDIAITPINDNPPKLLTKGEVLEVVDGFKTVISSKVLNSVDPDNTPDEVTYSIIRPGAKGKVVFATDPSTPTMKFSQKDINDGSVLFIPFSSNVTDATDDVFYYGLTDGIQRPAYNLFRVKIVPVFVEFKSNPIELLQGTYSSILTPDILNVSTNGNYSHLEFEVSQTSRSGLILVHEKRSNFFTYDELVEGEVAFAMTETAMSKDTMQITIKYNRVHGMNVSVLKLIDIVVQPLIVKGDLFACHIGLTRIGLSALNATALYVKANSQPVYIITSKPKYGKILKVKQNHARSKRNLGELNDILVEVDKFTHWDTVNGRVFLNAENINVTNGSLRDKVGLRLTVDDRSVQPADFVFDFSIIQSNPNDYTSFFNQFLPRVEEEITTAKVVMDDQQPTTSSKGTTDDPQVATKSLVSDLERNKLSEDPVLPEDSSSDNPQPAEAGVSWLIPVAVVVALVVILAIALAVVFTKRKHWCKRKKFDGQQYDGSDENRSLTQQENVEERIPDNRMDEKQENPESAEPLLSPACPGVTVTLLKNDPRFEEPDSMQPSVYGAEDRHSFSIIGSAAGPQSYRDDNPSTLYAPSTVYHYDDVGSVDFTDAPEVEFYAANQGHGGQRLYHARSAKFIDPDVLALYSSDESIPSMIDEKYAVPYDDSNMLTGSVPSGLHRGINHTGASRDEMDTSRSTASLSKTTISPELSLLPNSGLESNQYWI